MKVKLILGASILLLVSGQSNAALFEADYLSAGDGLITMDTNSTLEWLDLSLTSGMPFANALSAYSADGWRYAEQNEIFAMFDSNFTNINDNGSTVADPGTTTYDEAVHMVNMFGLTPSAPSEVSFGWYEDADDFLRLSGVWLANGGAVAVIYRDFNNNYDEIPAAPTPRDDGYPDVGTYLVRGVSPIPIPAAIWLFGTALIGFVGFCKRKKAV